jgi:hypothetical protein
VEVTNPLRFSSAGQTCSRCPTRVDVTLAIRGTLQSARYFSLANRSWQPSSTARDPAGQPSVIHLGNAGLTGQLGGLTLGKRAASSSASRSAARASACRIAATLVGGGCSFELLR